MGKYVPKRIILSGDDGILGNAVGIQVLKESGCSFVYLSDGWYDLAWPLQMSKLVAYWPDVLDHLAQQTGQILTKVSVNGKIRTSPL